MYQLTFDLVYLDFSSIDIDIIYIFRNTIYYTRFLTLNIILYYINLNTMSKNDVLYTS